MLVNSISFLSPSIVQEQKNGRERSGRVFESHSRFVTPVLIFNLIGLVFPLFYYNFASSLLSLHFFHPLI